MDLEAHINYVIDLMDEFDTRLMKIEQDMAWLSEQMRLNNSSKRLSQLAIRRGDLRWDRYE